MKERSLTPLFIKSSENKHLKNLSMENSNFNNISPNLANENYLLTQSQSPIKYNLLKIKKTSGAVSTSLTKSLITNKISKKHGK